MSLHRAPLALLTTFTYQPWEGFNTIHHVGDVQEYRYFWVESGVPLPLSSVAVFERVEASPELVSSLSAQSPDLSALLRPLQEKKLNRLAELNASYEMAVMQLRKSYPDAEASTWPDQARDAREYDRWEREGRQGEQPTLTFLEPLHVHREALGIVGSLSELAASILAYDSEYRLSVAQLTARRQAAERAIHAADQPENIQWSMEL